MDGIVRPGVGLVEPILDPATSVPALAHRERLERCITAQPAKLLHSADHPGSITLDEVESETVEADLIDHPLSAFNKSGIDRRIAVAKIGHHAELAVVPGFIARRM